MFTFNTNINNSFLFIMYFNVINYNTVTYTMEEGVRLEIQ